MKAKDAAFVLLDQYKPNKLNVLSIALAILSAFYAICDPVIAVSSSPSNPKLITLTDDFSQGSVDTSKWTVHTGTGYTFGIVTNQLQSTDTSTQSDYANITSNIKYDATSSEISVRLVASGNAASQAAAFDWCKLTAGGGNVNAVEIGVNNQALYAKQFVSSTPAVLTAVTYNATTMQYLRIREASGTVYWEYSADGNSWTRLYSEADPILMTSLYAEIGTGAFPGVTGTVVWDNVNNLRNNFTVGNDFTVGLATYYKLEEAANAIAIDSYWSNNSFQSSGVGSGTGIIGNCRTFSGNGNGALYFRYPHSLDAVNNPFSVTGWYKQSVTNPTHDCQIISKWPSWSLGMFNDDLTKGHNYASFAVSSDGSHYTIASSATEIFDTNWHFFVGVWDGANVKISLDGAAFISTPFAGPVYNNNGGGVSMWIGSQDNIDIMLGSLDEIGIWIGRALTQADVTKLYNGGSGLPFSSFGPNSSGLAILNQRLSGNRGNQYSGPLGFKFTANANIHVTSIGRWVVSGNSGSHSLAILDGSNNNLGSVTVNTRGATAGQYLYGTLGTPIALIAGNTYKCVSYETNGGDYWLQDDGLLAPSPSGDTTIIDGWANRDWNAGNYSFGPVNFQYTKP